VAALARSEALLRLVRPHLLAGDRASEPRAVRGIWFDKSPQANWLVAWHQDLTVAVREQVETPGYSAWSVKEGTPHVQPPTGVLERMLAVRLHLDDADAQNGALRVLPGSHRLGRLSAAQIQELRATQAEVLCQAAAGDALLLRPLLLHASGRSASSTHRRVLHLEYAGFDLPGGLRWFVG
jgi:ectoine hydroxylase-related dioxygenase (phytanoyl-CoA dioxygenase family)